MGRETCSQITLEIDSNFFFCSVPNLLPGAQCAGGNAFFAFYSRTITICTSEIAEQTSYLCVSSNYEYGRQIIEYVDFPRGRIGNVNTIIL